MKTFFIAIFMFVLGFIIGGGVGVNFTLNSGFDYLINSVQGVAKLPKNASENMKLLYEKKKDEMLKQINQKKDEIIKEIKENIKEQLKKQIENIFS